jgi:hypothetical protein
MQSSYAAPTEASQLILSINTRVSLSNSIRAATLATVFAITAFAAIPSVAALSFDGPWSLVVTTKNGPATNPTGMP